MAQNENNVCVYNGWLLQGIQKLKTQKKEPKSSCGTWQVERDNSVDQRSEENTKNSWRKITVIFNNRNNTLMSVI